MEVFYTRSEIEQYLANESPGKTLGFVPTMGALHPGHLALVEKARKESERVGVSIFINKRQFNSPEDYEKYPRHADRDLALLTPLNPDFVFMPREEDLFRDVRFPAFDLSPLDTILEGYFRPGHFRGVAEVLWVFFDLIRPSHVFMGQKDLQQCAVVMRLMREHFPKIGFVMVPTVRNESGLALSSRNERLSADARRRAGRVAQSLLSAADNLHKENWVVLREVLNQHILQEGFKTEYVELVSFPDFEIMTGYDRSKVQAVCIAYFAEGVRLIDNALVPEPGVTSLFS